MTQNRGSGQEVFNNSRVGSDQKVFEISRVEPGRVGSGGLQNLTGQVGSGVRNLTGRVGSGGLQNPTGRVGSGGVRNHTGWVGSARAGLDDSNREEPCKIATRFASSVFFSVPDGQSRGQTAVSCVASCT